MNLSLNRRQMLQGLGGVGGAALVWVFKQDAPAEPLP